MPQTARITSAAVAVAFAAVVLPESVSAQHGPADARIDSLFAEFNPSSPGAAVVVINGGKVIHRGGYGQANLEHGIGITPSTVFDIASVSKQFAGRAIATLVEQGTIQLEDDIRAYLPELPDFGRTITVDHLVHHTSGVRDWPGTLAVAGWRMDDVISFDQILTMAQNQKDLNFVPGAEYSYSNTGYNILARLVERVSGQSFREWTDANMFPPLGMTQTHFHDAHTEIVPNRAQGYVPTPSGFASVHNGLTALGSSSLFSTVDDLARWTMDLNQPPARQIAPLARMKQRGVLNNGERIAYAFGQSIGEFHGLETWSHSGSWAGFRSVLFRIPQRQFGVIILSNSGNYNPGRTANLIAEIVLADVIAGNAAPEDDDSAEETSAPVDAALLDAYAGTYRLGPAWLVTVTQRAGTLMIQATGEAQFRMRAVTPREFFVQQYGAAVTFVPAEDGSVRHIAYRGITAPRVDRYRHTADELGEYAGRYYSPELETEYSLQVDNGRLIAQHRRHGDIVLSSLLRDEFSGNQWFFSAVEFDRDPAGTVTGLRVSNGRSRNLAFERR